MLNALSTSISNIASLFLQTLRFSALLPTLCFVTLNQFVFPQMLGLDPETHETLGFFQQYTWTVLLTVVIGYTLSALNLPIIRLFEGYPFRFTWWGAALMQQQKEEKWKLKSRRHFYQEFYHLSKDVLLSQYTEEELETGLYCRIRVELGQLNYELDKHFPEQDAAVLPTKLGNSIAAFEEYPMRHYGIDAIQLWSHLLPVLSEKQYATFVEREKALLDFMLNMALLMSILSLEGIILELLGYRTGIWLTLISAAGAYSFYRGAIASALSWGKTVKVAFDLYRHELADRLALRPAWSLSEEKDQWERLSDFIENPAQGQFDYDYPLPRKAKT